MQIINRALSAALLLGLAACGSNSPSTENNPPAGNHPPANELKDDEFRFIGRATGAGPEAEVTVHLAGKSYTARTDSHEAFTVDVPLDAMQENAMVRFRARGEGARGHVELNVAAPDAGRLRTAAGDDRQLTRDEFVDMDLSPVAVGKYARLFIANDGEHITDSARYRALLRDAVDGNNVLLGAAVLQAVDAGKAALPAKHETTWALLADDGALTGFTRAHGAEAKSLRASAKAELDLANLAADIAAGDNEPFTPGKIPETYVLTEISRGILDLKGGILRFNEDGTGEHVTAAGTNAMSWRIDADGRLIVTPEPGKLAEFTTVAEFLLNHDNMETRTQEISGDIVFTLVRSGDFADLLTMEYNVTENNPEDDEGGFYPQTGVFLKAVTAVKPDGHEPFVAEELAGRTWAMPDIALGVTQALERIAQQVVPESIMMPGDGLVTFFEDNTGDAGGTSFTWTINDAGFLVLDFGGGAVIEYRKLRRDGPAFDLAVTGKDSASGEVYANSGLALPLDADATFAGAEPAGRYVRFGNGAARFNLQGIRPFAVEYHENGTASWPGLLRITDADKAWRIDGDDLVVEAIDRYTFEEGAPEYDPACDPSGDECYVCERQRLIPLRQDGDRTYVLEVNNVYWFARKDHALYGKAAMHRTSIAFWEPEASAEPLAE